MLKDLIGRVVYSKAGRDKGKMMVIVQVINSGFVVVADGDLRKIENPKVKNIKHLQLTNKVVEDVRESIQNGVTPENHILKKNLKKITKASEDNGKGVW